MGWDLGIGESIAAVILIGLSVRLLRAFSQRVRRRHLSCLQKLEARKRESVDDYGCQRHGFGDDYRHFRVDVVVVRVEIFSKVCVFNHHDDYEQLFVVDFVLAGGVDLLRTRRRQMEFRTRCEEVEKMLVEKSKGRETFRRWRRRCKIFRGG